MPDEKPGLWATLKDRWKKFKGAGRSGKPPASNKPTVDTSRVSAKPQRPQMNEQQRRATQGARTQEHTRETAKSMRKRSKPKPYEGRRKSSRAK